MLKRLDIRRTKYDLLIFYGPLFNLWLTFVKLSFSLHPPFNFMAVFSIIGNYSCMPSNSVSETTRVNALEEKDWRKYLLSRTLIDNDDFVGVSESIYIF